MQGTALPFRIFADVFFFRTAANSRNGTDVYKLVNAFPKGSIDNIGGAFNVDLQHRFRFARIEGDNCRTVVNLPDALHGIFQRSRVEQVTFHPFYRPLQVGNQSVVAVRAAQCADILMAGFDQTTQQVGTQKARSACDQNRWFARSTVAGAHACSFFDRLALMLDSAAA